MRTPIGAQKRAESAQIRPPFGRTTDRHLRLLEVAFLLPIRRSTYPPAAHDAGQARACGRRARGAIALTLANPPTRCHRGPAATPERLGSPSLPASQDVLGCSSTSPLLLNSATRFWLRLSAGAAALFYLQVFHAPALKLGCSARSCSAAAQPASSRRSRCCLPRPSWDSPSARASNS